VGHAIGTLISQINVFHNASMQELMMEDIIDSKKSYLRTFIQEASKWQVDYQSVYQLENDNQRSTDKTNQENAHQYAARESLASLKASYEDLSQFHFFVEAACYSQELEIAFNAEKNPQAFARIFAEHLSDAEINILLPQFSSENYDHDFRLNALVSSFAKNGENHEPLIAQQLRDKILINNAPSLFLPLYKTLCELEEKKVRQFGLFDNPVVNAITSFFSMFGSLSLGYITGNDDDAQLDFSDAKKQEHLRRKRVKQ